MSGGARIGRPTSLDTDRRFSTCFCSSVLRSRRSTARSGREPDLRSKLNRMRILAAFHAPRKRRQNRRQRRKRAVDLAPLDRQRDRRLRAVSLDEPEFHAEQISDDGGHRADGASSARASDEHLLREQIRRSLLPAQSTRRCSPSRQYSGLPIQLKRRGSIPTEPDLHQRIGRDVAANHADDGAILRRAGKEIICRDEARRRRACFAERKSDFRGGTSSSMGR